MADCPQYPYWAAHDLSVYTQRELRARELSNSVEDALTMTEPCPAHGDFVITPDADSFADTSPPECSPMDCSEPQDFGRPEACSYLQAGQEFDGTQRVSQAPANLSEDWGVQVSIEQVRWETGYVCGSMRAENVPQAKTPVVTFWEGDIIDNVNHCFVTSKWGAEKKVDVKHWKRFEGFQSISNCAEAACGRCPGLSTHTHIFMRWKEKKFVNVGDDCGLTIAGFYYVCLSRRDGSIEGFYHDPHSSPYQRLRLKNLHRRYVSSHHEYQS